MQLTVRLPLYQGLGSWLVRVRVIVGRYPKAGGSSNPSSKEQDARAEDLALMRLPRIQVY